ncbi:hypothetical protein O6H91_07G096100 [Diphasiastrum complanatum]|uniref:Uncharacterized protein n=1 Tax=Diphasiastrum complanatum TaxID=34168 RepID=A0ACC2D824_DIPCM|nr:hypothetical protein O6H91_07G096100 [Diphasiastrum complanatum]
MTMSTATSVSGEASESSGNHDGGGSVLQQQQHNSASSALASNTTVAGQQPPVKKKRNLPGTPDPDAEVIALSPKTLMATNRFLCEICGKGFQRDQNLQLHRRGHNLPWKLRQRTSKEPRKRVYICPEPSCVHHNPARALGDLTGIKKHFCRKHGEKKWKCDKCNKRYAVQSDWKAHSKTCGTREYRCDCGTLFSRRDSFITHRAFCDALAEENARVSASKQGGTSTQVTAGVENNTMGSSGAPQASSLGGPSPAPGSYLPQILGGFGNLPGVGMSEEEFPWLPPKWNQSYGGGAPGLGTPRLSLLLGSGPGGPGPPAGSNHMLGGLSHLQAGDSSHLNSMDVGGSSYFMQPPKSMHVGSGMQPDDFAHSDMETSHLLSSNPFSNPFSPGMAFPGLHGSAVAHAGGSSSLGVAAISDMMGAANRLERRSSTAAGLSLSSNAGFPNGSSSAGANETGRFPFPSSTMQNPPLQQQPTSQMSATALLQKAAQMGATASNSFLLRGFGMAGTDTGSFGLGAFWQGPRQEQARGGSMPNLSAGMINSNMQAARRPLDQSASGEGSSLTSPGYGAAQGRSSERAHQDMVSATPGYPGMFGTGSSFPTMFGSNSNAPGSNSGGSMNQPSSINTMSRQMSGAGEISQSNPFNGSVSDPHSGVSTMLPGLSVLPKVEEGADRLTRDFLGVNGSGGRSGRQLSQKDLASLVSIGANGEIDPFNSQRDSMMALNATR